MTMTAARWHWLFRAVFAAYIAYASIRTALESWPVHAPDAKAGAFIFWLASIEAIAAAALLWQRSQVVAGVVLCLIFAVAAALETASGGVPARFFYYAASVAVILGLDGIARTDCSARRA